MCLPITVCWCPFPNLFEMCCWHEIHNRYAFAKIKANDHISFMYVLYNKTTFLEKGL